MTYPPPSANLAARLDEARQRFDYLHRQFLAGELDQAAFDGARAPLATPDNQGGYWTPDVDGAWLHYDGHNWAPAQPPLPATGLAPAQALPARRGPSPWLLLGALVAIGLVAGFLAWRAYGAGLLAASPARSATMAPTVTAPAAVAPATPTAPLAHAPDALLAPLTPFAPDDRPAAADPRLLLDDPFDRDEGRWSLKETKVSHSYLADGQYVMAIKQADQSSWTSYGWSDRDAYLLVVDVIPLDDAPGSHGLIFLQGEAGYYRLDVDTAGRYRVRLRDEDSWREIAPWTASPHLATGLTPNRLGVAVQAGQMTLLANGYRLATLPEELGLTGRIGLFAATTADSAGHAAAFDNLKLYAPFDGPVAYSDEQLQLIMDAGLPQSFALVQFETRAGPVRHETWSYHDAGLSFLFEDGRFATWEEAEAQPPSLQPNAWRPDQFALGAPLSDWQARFDADGWALLADEALLGQPLTLYTNGQVTLGFYEEALALVHAPAQSGGAP